MYEADVGLCVWLLQAMFDKVKMGTGHVVGFINNMVGLFNHLPHHWKSFDPYFRVLSHFASLGPGEATFLQREHDLVPRMIDLFVGEKSSHKEINAFAPDSK